MTQPPGPLCALFRRHLRDVGLKYTPERARTLDAAFHMGRAFEVDELMQELVVRGGGASKGAKSKAKGGSGAARARFRGIGSP